VEALVSPEFSGLFLNEFEDCVYLLCGPVEVLGGERVEGEGLDSVFEAPVEYLFSYFGADDVSVVWPEGFRLRPSSVTV
jgi:hypothetical protein